MAKGHLTQQERHRIAAGLAGELTYAEIARRIGRPTSTVSREVARNGGPDHYNPQQAQRASHLRHGRGVPAAERRAVPTDPLDEEILELAVRTGLPRTTARVHLDLLLAEDGSRTAADLAQRLRVSPASVSAAVTYLVEQGYVRREREPGRRHDVYAVDDEAWYHAVVINARHLLATAEAARNAADRRGPDTPVGGRLSRTAAYLKQVAKDSIASAEKHRGLLG